MLSTSILVPAVGVELSKFISNLWYKKNQEEKPIVYVVGNGWGSYHFVKNLDKSKFKSIIIAPNSKVLNTPRLTNRVIDSNAQVEFDNPYGEQITGMLEDIDYKNKLLVTKSGLKLPFNKVVLAIGSEPNDFGIPGVNENALKFKTLSDADLLRENLSNNKFPDRKIFVVGSGVTGIELASKLGMQYDLMIIEGLGSILPGYNDLTKKIIFNWLETNQPNIKIKLNHMVKFIDNNRIDLIVNKSILQTQYNRETDLIVWTGGVRFCGYEKTVLYKTLNSLSPIKPRGIDVKEDFSIGGHTDIYCIGDMVANMGSPSAQNAKLQGEWLAKYFNSGFDNKYIESNKFESVSKGKLVHLDSKIYLESDKYSGFVPGVVDRIIEWINK